MFWTAVCAGGVVVVGATDDGMLSEIMIPFNLAAYLAVICGLTTIIRYPTSLDSWLPLGAGLVLFFLLLPLSLLIELGDGKEAFASLVLIIGIGLGIYLFIRNIKRTMRTGFSLAVAVYHLATWVGWMAIGVVMKVFSHGWD